MVVEGDLLAVSLDWDKTIVNPTHTTVLEGAGAVVIFHRQDGRWEEEAALSAENATEDLEFTNHPLIFGSSIDLSGDSLVVGALGDHSSSQGVNGDPHDVAGFLNGAAFVYVRTHDRRWVREAYLKAHNSEPRDAFGATVAIEGDLVLVGAPNEDGDTPWYNGADANDELGDSGAVYAFERVDHKWRQTAHIKQSPPIRKSHFGSMLKLNGDVMVTRSLWYDGEWHHNNTRYKEDHLLTYRKIAPPPTAIALTLAGGGALSGHGVSAYDLALSAVSGVAAVPDGQIFLADPVSNAIWGIDQTNYLVSLIAGLGQTNAGAGGTNLAKSVFRGPQMIGISLDGNILAVPDRDNRRIHRLNRTDDLVTTFGSNVQLLGEPRACAIHPDGSIYFTSFGSNTVLRLTPGGAPEIFAGTGVAGHSGDGGPATLAKLNSPAGLAFDQTGNLFVADTGNHVIRRIDAISGEINRVAGTGIATFDLDEVQPTSASLNSPEGVAVDQHGNIYISDSGNHRIRAVWADRGFIQTVMGTGVPGMLGDGGDAQCAELNHPAALAVNIRGDVFVADVNNRRLRVIRRVNPELLLKRFLEEDEEELTLLGDTSSFRFAQETGGPIRWRQADTNVIEVVPGTGNIVSTQDFGAIHLQAEFRLTQNSVFGDSGIFLQGRYELQLTNSFGLTNLGIHDCGALFDWKAPVANACLSPTQWQNLDIIFHPAQWNDTNKIRFARIDASMNGVRLHHDIKLPTSTPGGHAELPSQGPLLIQDGGVPIQFRNISVSPVHPMPKAQWLRAAGGISDDLGDLDGANGVAVDEHGHTYVVGQFTTDARFSSLFVTNAGDADFFLAKYDETGELLWARTAGGTSADAATAVCVDSHGNPIVVGYLGGSLDIEGQPVSHTDGRDAFVAKFAADGTLLWLRTDHGNEDENPTAVATDSEGRVFVTGNFTSEINYSAGTVTKQSAGGHDLYVAGFSATGTLEWQRTFGGADSDLAHGIVADESGGAWVVGDTMGGFAFDSLQMGARNSREGFLLHLDSRGRTLELDFTLGTMIASFDAVTRDLDGYVYAHGWFDGPVLHFGTNVFQNVGGRDSIVLKRDPAGREVWMRQVARNSPAPAASIALTRDRGLLVTANYTGNASVGGVTVMSQVSRVGNYLAKFSADGDFNWIISDGGRSTNTQSHVAVDRSGRIVLAGTFGPQMIVARQSLPSVGAGDMHLIQYGSEVTPDVPIQWSFDQQTASGALPENGGGLPVKPSAAGVALTPGFSTNAIEIDRTVGGYAKIPSVRLAVDQPLSIALLFRTEPGDSQPSILLSQYDADRREGYFIGLNGTVNHAQPGQVIFSENGSLQNAISSTRNDLNDGQWHSLIVTHNPYQEMRMYVDGVIEASAPATTLRTARPPLLLAGQWADNSVEGMFSGRLDELHIYPWLLDPQEAGLLATFPEEQVNRQTIAPMEWVKFIGEGPGIHVECNAVIAGPDHTVYVAGSFRNNVQLGTNVTVSSRGNADIFLARYDSAGELLWARSGGGAFDDRATDLAIDRDGNILLSGTYVGNALLGGYTLSESGNGLAQGGFVAKYTSNGDLVLIREGWGEATAVHADALGNIYLGGRSRLLNVIDGKFLRPEGALDAWVARFTPIGGVDWATSFGGAEDDAITDIKMSSTGQLIAVGTFSRSMSLGGTLYHAGGPQNQNTSPFQVTIDAADGKIIDAVTGVGMDHADVNTLSVDTNGSTHIGGGFADGLSFDSLLATNLAGVAGIAERGFLATFNTNRTPVRLGTFPGPVHAILGDAQRNRLVFGNFTDTNNGNHLSGYVQKIDRGGFALNTRLITGPGDVVPASGNGISQDQHGNVYLAGSTRQISGGAYRFDDATVLSPAPGSAFVAKITSPIGIRRHPVDQVATNLNVRFRVLPSGRHPFRYQWYHDGAVLDGATNAQLILNSLATVQPGQYHVVITNPDGIVTSDPASLSRNLAPIILDHPDTVSAPRTKPFSLSVRADGTRPFSYQWFKDGVPVVGQTNEIMLIPSLAATDEGSYRVKVTNSVGSAFSFPAIVTSLPVDVLPEIVTAPGDRNEAFGQFVSFETVATGALPLQYQWRYNRVAIAGAVNTNLFIFNLGTNHAGDYDVIVYNSHGAVTSSPARLDLFHPVPPVLSSHPHAATRLAGGSVSFRAQATGSPPLLYQWIRNNTSIPGATNDTLTLTNLMPEDAAAYKLRAVNGSGYADSVAAVLTVQIPPRFTVHPISVIASNLAQSVTLSVVATGLPAPHLQWFKNGTALTNGNGYFGVNSSNLMVPAADQIRLGTYSATATSPAGEVDSRPAVLGLNFPPMILEQPHQAQIRAGLTHRLSIIVTGAPPIAVRWLKDGELLTDHHGFDLTLTEVERSDSGIYRASISNQYGTAETTNISVLAIVPQALSAPRLLPDRFRFSFRDVIGQMQSNGPSEFRVQFTTNLSDWFDLDSAPLRSNDRFTVEDPLAGPNKIRYYRVIEP